MRVRRAAGLRGEVPQLPGQVTEREGLDHVGVGARIETGAPVLGGVVGTEQEDRDLAAVLLI
ncbi:MAG TPA: hypothetical protein VGI17_14965 [Solirubrobacterales bacterium]